MFSQIFDAIEEWMRELLTGDDHFQPGHDVY